MFMWYMSSKRVISKAMIVDIPINIFRWTIHYTLIEWSIGLSTLSFWLLSAFQKDAEDKKNQSMVVLQQRSLWPRLGHAY